MGTILLVSDVTLAAALDTIRLLSGFKQNIPGARVILVANKFQSAIGELSRKEFESSIERPIDIVIPFDPKLVAGGEAREILRRNLQGHQVGAGLEQSDAPGPRWRRRRCRRRAGRRRERQVRGLAARAADRKSTRLNSSH